MTDEGSLQKIAPCFETKGRGEGITREKYFLYKFLEEISPDIRQQPVPKT